MQSKTINLKYEEENNNLFSFLLNSLNFLITTQEFHKTSQTIKTNSIKWLIIPTTPRWILRILIAFGISMLYFNYKNKNTLNNEKNVFIIFSANDPDFWNIYYEKNTIYLPLETQTTPILGKKINLNTSIINKIKNFYTKNKQFKIIQRKWIFNERVEILELLFYTRILLPKFKIIPIIIGNLEINYSKNFSNFLFKNYNNDENVYLFSTIRSKNNKKVSFEEFNKSANNIISNKISKTINKNFINKNLFEFITIRKKTFGLNAKILAQYSDEKILVDWEPNKIYSTISFFK